MAAESVRAIMRESVLPAGCKKTGPSHVTGAGFLCEVDLLIEHPDVFGARTLRPLAEAELDVIALVHASTIECGLVEEDVCATVVLLDEPEPLQVIEAIDNAGHQRKR